MLICFVIACIVFLSSEKFVDIEASKPSIISRRHLIWINDRRNIVSTGLTRLRRYVPTCKFVILVHMGMWQTTKVYAQSAYIVNFWASIFASQFSCHVNLWRLIFKFSLSGRNVSPYTKLWYSYTRTSFATHFRSAAIMSLSRNHAEEGTGNILWTTYVVHVRRHRSIKACDYFESAS